MIETPTNYDRYWRDRLANDYTPVRPRHRLIAQYIASHCQKGQTVLDLGCGEGHILQMLPSHLRRYGCDISLVPFRKIKGNDIETQVCDLDTSWPSWMHPWDFVIASELLEHMKNPNRPLGEIAARMADNGIFLCTIPNVWNWQYLWPRLRGRKPNYDKSHLHFWTLPQFARLLRQRGFEVLSSEPTITITPNRFPRVIRKILPKIPLMKYLTGEQFLFVCRRKAW